MKLQRTIFIAAVVLTTVLLLAGCAGLRALAPAIQSLTVAPADDAGEPAAVPAVEVVEEAVVDWVAPEDALVSIPVDSAPVLDGMSDEAFWADAPSITVEVYDGANMGDGEVTLQSVYADDMVYFLVTWADETESFVRSPWVKQDDGTWAKLRDPNDKGGDNNVYYEDKMALIWTIDNSIPKFENQGCYTACHTSRGDDPKPYGNKFTDEGRGDIWHWKSVRNVGQIDDQYLDSTPYSPETPEAGRKSDPKESGGYADNQTEDKSMPMWMGPDGSPRDGAPGYILDAEKLPFDDSLFVSGDMVPGIIKSPITGDRGDIAAGWHWADGVWTIEFGRKLVTGSEFDVQFSDLGAEYYFGIAVFDNAQVRHAFQEDVSFLVFQP